MLPNTRLSNLNLVRRYALLSIQRLAPYRAPSLSLGACYRDAYTLDSPVAWANSFADEPRFHCLNLSHRVPLRMVTTPHFVFSKETCST